MEKKQPHEKRIYTYPDGTTLVYYQQNLDKCTDVVVGFRIPRINIPTNDEIIGVYKNKLVFYQSFDGTIRIPVIKPGLPHFVEHMIYSSLPDMKDEEIFNYLMKTNTEYNAYTTSDDLTAIFNCPSKFNEEIFALFSKLIFRDRYNKEDLKNEKIPVFQELQLYVDGSENPIMDMLNANTNGLSLFELVGIDKKIIDSYDEKQMLRFINTYFTKQNMVISVVSDRSFDEIKALCDKNFVDKAPSIPETRVKTPKSECHFNDIMLTQKDPMAKTSDITFILKSKSDIESENMYSHVENFILNNFSGRLLKKLRNHNAKVYSSNFSNANFNGNNFKFIDAQTTKRNVKEVISSMLSILSDMARNGITDEEYAGFKEMWENRRDRHASVKFADARDLFNKIIDNENPFTGEINKKVSEVTKEDINNYLKEAYSNSNFCFCITGNFEEKDLPTKYEISKFRPYDEYLQNNFIDFAAKDEFVSYLEYIDKHPEDNKKIKFVKDGVYKEYEAYKAMFSENAEKQSEDADEDADENTLIEVESTENENTDEKTKDENAENESVEKESAKKEHAEEEVFELVSPITNKKKL